MNKQILTRIRQYIPKTKIEYSCCVKVASLGGYTETYFGNSTQSNILKATEYAVKLSAIGHGNCGAMITFTGSNMDSTCYLWVDALTLEFGGWLTKLRHGRRP